MERKKRKEERTNRAQNYIKRTEFQAFFFTSIFPGFEQKKYEMDGHIL